VIPIFVKKHQHARMKRKYSAAVIAVIVTIKCGLLIFYSPSSYSGWQNYEHEGKPITLKNWQTNPEIVKIRKIYTETMQLLDTGKLKINKVEINTTQSDECRRPGASLSQEIALNDTGKVRIYRHSSFVSHGGVIRLSYFYDREGRIRFGVVQHANVQGSEYDAAVDRIYYTTNGEIFFYIEQHSQNEFSIQEMKNDWFAAAGPQNAKKAQEEFDINIGSAECPIKDKNNPKIRELYENYMRQRD